MAAKLKTGPSTRCSSITIISWVDDRGGGGRGGENSRKDSFVWWWWVGRVGASVTDWSRSGGFRCDSTHPVPHRLGGTYFRQAACSSDQLKQTKLERLTGCFTFPALLVLVE